MGFYRHLKTTSKTHILLGIDICAYIHTYTQMYKMRKYSSMDIVHTYICIAVHNTYIYLYIYIYIYIRMKANLYGCIHENICMYICIHVYVGMYMYIHVMYHYTCGGQLTTNLQTDRDEMRCPTGGVAAASIWKR